MIRLLGDIFLAVLILLFLAGCASSPTPALTPETSKIKKVAVLPFYNISGRKGADKIVTSTFVIELFKDGRFYVEEPGNVTQFMIQERVDTVGEIEIERLKILGRRLNVDAVIAGMIEEFNDGTGSHSVPVVSITARMVKSSDGKVIWSARNKRRGDDYIIAFEMGRVRSVATLTQRTVQEMIGTIR